MSTRTTDTTGHDTSAAASGGSPALAARARRIRRRATLVEDPVLRPLVVAMKRRAAELELESAVLAARWA